MKPLNYIAPAVMIGGLACSTSPAFAATGQVKIPANDIARIVNGALTDAKLRLHNRGNWTGGSYYDPNASSLRLFGGSRRLNIPAFNAEIYPTKYMYYVDDLNSEAIVFQRENGGYVLKMFFESGGTEIKGLCRTRRGLGRKRHWGVCRTVGKSDNEKNDRPAPDAQLNDVQIKVPLQLYIHPQNGGLAMRSPNCRSATSIRANLKINGVLGWGDNNLLEQFVSGVLRASVRNEICDGINASEEQKQMGQDTISVIRRLNSALAGAASLKIARINSDGSIVVSYSTPLSLGDIKHALKNLKMTRAPMPKRRKVAQCRGELAYSLDFRPAIAGRLSFFVEGAGGKTYATWSKSVAAGEHIAMRLKRPVGKANGKLKAINGHPAIETKTRVKFSFESGGEKIEGTIPWVKKTLKCRLRRIANVAITHKNQTTNAASRKGRADVVANFRSAYGGKLIYQFEGENGALTTKLEKRIQPNRAIKLKVSRTLGGPKSTTTTRSGNQIVQGKSRMHWAIVVEGQTFQGKTRWTRYQMAFPLSQSGAGSVAGRQTKAKQKSRTRAEDALSGRRTQTNRTRRRSESLVRRRSQVR